MFHAKKAIIALTAAAGLVAGLAWCQPPAARASALTGVWQLNKGLSQAPKAPQGGPDGTMGGPPGGGMGGRRGGGMGGRQGGGMGPGGSGGPGGFEPGGMGGRHGGAGGRDGGGAGPDGGAGRGALLGGAASIKVIFQDADIHIISADGRVRILTPNNQPVDRERGFFTVSETARWAEGRLEITSATPRGMIVTETIGAAEDGSGRLVHTVEMKRAASDETRSARWVYDKATSN